MQTHVGNLSSFRYPYSLSSPRRLIRDSASVLLLSILFLTTLLSACGNDALTTKGETILFGAPLSLTGSTATEGRLTLEGYQLWVKYVNSNGGIRIGDSNYQIALKYYDDESTPAKSAQLVQRLITVDKVKFLLGPYGTAATLQAGAIAEQHQIPMVEGNGAASSIFSRGFKHIFGVMSPAASYAQVMLQAALALPNAPKNVAIISANDAFSTEVAAGARAYADSHNLPVVYYQQYPSGATDLTSVLTDLKSSGPDGTVPDMILGSGHEAEAITTMKQCRQLNIDSKLYAFTVGPGTPDFRTSLGKDANYVISSAQWTAQAKYDGIDVFKTPANYEQLYQKDYGHLPAYQSASATAAGLAFQYAIQRAGSLDPQKVRNALASLDIMTFYGQIRFNEAGVNTYKPMATIQIQKDNLVTVYPQEIANANLQFPTPPFSER